MPSEPTHICAACQVPAVYPTKHKPGCPYWVGGAAPSAPTTDAPTVDKGRLWALIRDVLSQGTAIERDNVEGCYPTYEAWSARLDAAARERVADFTAVLRGGATAPTPDDPKVEGVVRRVEEAAGAARQLAELAGALARDLTNTETLARVRLRRDTGASHE